MIDVLSSSLRHAESGISSLIALTFSNLSRRLFGGQRSLRRDAEPRTVAGRSSSPTFPPLEEPGPSNHNLWSSQPASASALSAHHALGVHGGLGMAAAQGRPPIPPLRTRRQAMRNMRYNADLEFSRTPLGSSSWSSSRRADGKPFLLQHSSSSQHPSPLPQYEHRKSELPFPGHFLVRAQAHTRASPSTQAASVRGSFRSEGSGQSALHTTSHSHGTASAISMMPVRQSPMFSFSSHLAPVPPYSSPERFRAASAMQLADAPSLRSLLQSGSPLTAIDRELPLLRPIQQHHHQHLQQPQPIYQNVGPLAHSGFLRATMPLAKGLQRPIPYHPAMERHDIPFGNRHSALGLRHSQRRRFDMKIAQIRREREETRVQLFNRPPYLVGNTRLCQV